MRLIHTDTAQALTPLADESAQNHEPMASQMTTPETFHGPDKGVEVEAPAASLPAHRNRTVAPILVGIFGFFALWGWTASSAAANAYAVFVNVPAAILTLIAPLAIMTAVYGWAGVVDAVLWVFRKPAQGQTAQEAAVFWQLFAAFSLASGCIGTLIGLVAVMSRLAVPTTLGSGIAVSLLTQLYGVFLAVIGISLSAHIARRHNSAAAAATIARRGASLAGVTTIAGVLTAMIAFGMLMLSISPSF